MSVSSTSDKLSNGAVHDVLMQSIASGDAALVSGMAAHSLSSSMGQDEVVKMNLMAIRRIDSQVEAIHSTVPQVVLYQYDGTNNTWERTPVEGTLFVYSRVSSPGHGFMILNRLSSDNVHDLLSPDLEFRVQKSFVLFKRSSGKILGLCFQEEQLCQEIGDLLTNLSRGISNGYSGETHRMTASMRSKSAPAINKQAHTYPASSSHQKVDVLEMLETAGRSYLGQPFSDDADSQDSLTSDPITFEATPAYDHQQHKELARKSRTSNNHRSSEPSAAAKPRNKGGRNSHLTGSTSPKNIPGVSPAAQMPQSFSMSPKQVRHRASSLKQNGSTSHRQRGQLQHASSFSSKNYPVKDQKERNGSLPGSRSTSPFSTSPQVKHSGTREPHTEADGGSADANKIVRKLFGPDTTSGDCELTPASSSSSSTLQTLFSQSSGESERVPITVSADKGSDLLQLKVISLAEVEQQMKAEVPSPETAIPFTLFNSTAHTQPDAHSGHDQHVSLDEKAQVLLQPSAFVTRPLGSSVNSAQVTTAITTEFAYSPSQGAHQFARNVSTSPVQSSASPKGNSHPKPSTPGSVSIMVAPPSPVVTQSRSSGTFMSPTTHTHLTQSFPPIPPLMHSPGMKAAPIAVKKNGKEFSSDGKRRHAVEHCSQAVHNLHVSFDEAVPNERQQIAQRSRTVSEPSVFENRTSSTTGSECTAQTAVPASSGLTPLPELEVSHSTTTVPSTLMSPMQFATRQNTDAVNQDVFDGLTREQFQQALVYLIQHDDDFLGKVHQAYQLSLAEKQPRT